MTTADNGEADGQTCDVAVIGGGPGGSTVATLLARQGYRVALFEKARHPRFHIGESLLPANLPLFEELGVGAEIRAIGMEKWGAEFVSPWHAEGRQAFVFADAWNKALPHAYQVQRAPFDDILFRNAIKNGVQAHEGCRVTDVEFLPGRKGVVVHSRRDDGAAGKHRARFLIDASGRDTFLANRMHSKRRNPRHNSAAMFAQFRNARRHPGRDEGNISIFWFDDGWFWFIPLPEGITSVGAVVWPYYMKRRDKPVAEYFQETINKCPALAERLRDAERVTDVEATGNFSYLSTRSHGPNYLLLGDAFAFIDPVFSSGVMLAMQSAFAAAAAVEAILSKRQSERAALRAYDRNLRHGPRQFAWFIYRINQPSMRDLFMRPSNRFRAKEALLSVLAGDIFGETPIWKSLRAFKTVYYIHVWRHALRSLRAWVGRRRNIRVATEEA